ncbi:MAG: glucose-6-phosphate dehydrogenase assembly protein OpcA [candidate division KSB1 bacterium]|nr:glucose-6-phosphate dehydrogenase assembly protein OpcA [candidate division KSB1 bacterium]MDZ7366949.1 glucose-6-phosphate dehydrogenase assembly protein OpcA [candidate division KSB1 bacterium]MDZ7406834.1 glucose-6-phosphate dehydrogenase assembly protein OpcA [candidate division KSB1 bacterium]
MSADELVDGFVKGEPLAVAVDEIATKLEALWQGLTAQMPDCTRACNLNLLLFSPHEGAYERAAHQLVELTRRQPARVIALIAEPEADENEISSYVSAHFHDVDGKKTGCEQITISAKGNVVDKLPEIVVPLIASDLPAVLWWQGDLPEESVLFEKLIAASRQLIFDSADGRDAGATLSQARALTLNWESGVCSDLNWRRTARWREVVAEFLESPVAASRREQLAEISVEAVAAPEGDVHFAQPLLFLGWLANLLSWKLNEPLTAEATAGSENIFRTSWQAASREAIGKVVLRQPESGTDETTMPGGTLSVQIRFQPDDGALVFSAQRNFHQGKAAVQVTEGGQTISETTLDFSETPAAELLSQEITSPGREAVYESALRFATQLI